MFSSSVTLLFLIALKFSSAKKGVQSVDLSCPESRLAKYVSAVINTVAAEDRTRNHEVTLVRFDENRESEVFDEIAGEIVRSNPGNPVFIQSKLEIIEPYRVHASSVFVLTVESINSVTKKIDRIIPVLKVFSIHRNHS